MPAFLPASLTPLQNPRMQAHAMHHESPKKISPLTNLYSKGKSKRLLFLNSNLIEKPATDIGITGLSICRRKKNFATNYINREPLSSFLYRHPIGS
jgi:hypothetical protein